MGGDLKDGRDEVSLAIEARRCDVSNLHHHAHINGGGILRAPYTQRKSQKYRLLL